MHVPTSAESWMRAVAANPSAPASALLRLLRTEGKPAWASVCLDRALPDEVIEAALAHPHVAVREHLARNRHVDPAQRGRLAEDADPEVRHALAGGPPEPVGRRQPLPDKVIERILTAHDEPGDRVEVTADQIRDALEGSWQIPASFHAGAFAHPNPEIRAHATKTWWWLTAEQRERLLNDPVSEVRERALAENRLLDPDVAATALPEQEGHFRWLLLACYPVSTAVARRCLDERRDLWALAQNPHTPYSVVRRLAEEPDPGIRGWVASRCDLDPGLLARLAEDPDADVRARAQVIPRPRTERQRQAIDRVVGRSAEDVAAEPERSDQDDADWFAACAESENSLLRRVAATDPHLPADLVAQLARDSDEQVRHLLAYHHPAAPPRLLLDAFTAHPRQRAFLRRLPHLPRTGLAHLLDHHDPEVRALAAADTTLPAPPRAQLDDADGRVRDAAAANPRSPGTFSPTCSPTRTGPRPPRATRSCPPAHSTTCSPAPAYPDPAVPARGGRRAAAPGAAAIRATGRVRTRTAAPSVGVWKGARVAHLA